jgi:pyruvate formate lyase activating enzyme
VFLKGCPLACRWCHNPEALDARPEVAFHPRLCVADGACARACPSGAIDGAVPGRVDRARCRRCGRCAEACPSTALRLVGEPVSPEQLVARLLRDRAFYDTSGGGVTFSGGEPTLHLSYVASVARALRRERVHVLVQTCGEFELEPFRAELLPWVDLLHFDLKLADPAAHRRETGRDNARILRNFRALAAEVPSRLVARVPLVPGITATPENLSALGALVRAAGCRHALLPWNPGAGAKRALLGAPPDPGLPSRLMRPEEERAATRWFAGVPAASEAIP